MISEFQRKKLTHFFNLLDSHKNGYLHEDDFLEISERIRLSLGYEEGGQKHSFLTSKSKGFFEMLTVQIDENGDQIITLKEWYQFLEEKIIGQRDEEFMSRFKEYTIGFIFDLFDDNHDGFISTDEFVDMFVVYGIDIRYSGKSFRKIDVNKDDLLSREELLEAFEVFLLSSDTEQPGNWIFGNWGE